MRFIFTLFISVFFCSSLAVGQMTSFTKGNFALIKVQNPSSAVGSIILQEYSPAGALVQQLDFNSSSITSPNNKMVSPIIGASETEYNYLSLSMDKRFITFGGYVTPGSGAFATAGVTRAGALVKYDGTVNTQTTFTGSSYLFTKSAAASTASTSLTLTSNSALILSGNPISGAGIPDGTTIVSFNTTSKVAVLSQAATVANDVPVYIELNSPATNFVPKSVATTDGSGLWMVYSGISSTANGILYQPVNGTGAPVNVLASIPGANLRQLNFSSYDNNMYIGRSNASTLYLSGAQTTTYPSINGFPPNSASGVPVINGSRGFCFVSPAAGGGEVLYIAVVSPSYQAGAVSNATVAGSTTLTLSAANANFAAGNYVSGPGITPGTTVVDNTGTTVTLSQAATMTQNGQTYFTASPTIKGIYKFYRTSNANSWTAAGSFGNAGDNYLSVTAEPKQGGGFTLYATKFNPTGNGVSATAQTATAALTSGSTDIVLSVANANFVAGNQISGTGIPTGTTITNVSGTTVTLSAAATSNNGSVTVTTYPSSVMPCVVKITDDADLADFSNATETVIVKGINQQALRGISMVPVAPSTLPIHLGSFDADKQNGKVLISWTTSSESNVKDFVIEKSTDGVSFSTLGTVKAKNAASGSSYMLTDLANNFQTTYYRLRTNDQDGQVSLSRVVAVTADGQGVQSLYPNPASDQITINLNTPYVAGNLKVYATNGQVVINRSLVNGTKSIVLDISDLKPGTYIVSLTNGKSSSVQKFIKR